MSLKIEICTHLKIVNFLDVTFNLSDNTFKPFDNSNYILTYIIIIKGFRTIVFIFIVISTTFRPICPPAFLGCLSNSGTFTELRTTSFIEFR